MTRKIVCPYCGKEIEIKKKVMKLDFDFSSDYILDK